MLPEIRDLNNYERNMFYSGFISAAIDIVKTGTPLSSELKVDLVELENRLETEVDKAKASVFNRNPYPITLQNIGKIAALRSQGAIS
jgi:hypothetical protein